MTPKEAIKQFIKEFVDLKYQLVAVSTVLFYLGHMSEVTWSVFVLSVTGFRMAGDFATLIKGKKDDNQS